MTRPAAAHSLVAALSLASVALVGCTSAQVSRERAQSRAATAFLDRQGSIGDPGRVAAADFAMARAAREDGQAAAMLASAAAGAQVHLPAGITPAAEALRSLAAARRTDPASADAWEPNTVWSSCDGTVAVTFGRVTEAGGLVGSYAAVWQLQRNNAYRWVYRLAARDVPQPPPPIADDIPDDAIVVPGLSSISGMIADCPRTGAEIAAPPPPAVAGADGMAAVTLSADGTLGWSQGTTQDGRRRFVLHWLRDGEWQTALDFAPVPWPEGA